MNREQKFALRVLAPVVLPLAPAGLPEPEARPQAMVHVTASSCSPAPSAAPPEHGVSPIACSTAPLAAPPEQGVSSIACGTAPSTPTRTEDKEEPAAREGDGSLRNLSFHLPTFVHPEPSLSPVVSFETCEEAAGLLLRRSSSQDAGIQEREPTAAPGTGTEDPAQAAQGSPARRFNVQGRQRPELSSSPGSMRPASGHPPLFSRGNSLSRALRQGALTLIDKVSL